EEAAEAMAYDLAHRFKEKLDLLEKYQAKSLVTSPSVTSLDIFSIVTDEKHAYVNYLKIKNGAINVTKTVELKKRLDESEAELLITAIIRLRDQFESTSKDRKSTRLNSSHVKISYAVFCLK